MSLSDQELSALVAQHVYPNEWKVPPPFATDHGLALEAALKALRGRELTITEHIDSWFEASYRHVDPDGHPGSSGWVSSCGPTTARALCLIALRAIGVEVEDDGGGE